MSVLDLNDLFVSWLNSQHEELTKKGTKTAYAYLRASAQIRAFPDHIVTPRQLTGIQYVGAKLVKFLCSRLKKYCAENSIPVPVEFENYVGDTTGGKRSHELDAEVANKKKKTTSYIPKRRSGSWAILVSLYTKDRARRGLRKEEVISGAEPHCDKAFTANPAARDYYSAWDGVKTLMKRGLVEEFGRPKVYTITEEGATLAAVLLKQEGIQSSPERAPEMSFDNGLRVSPGSSVRNSSSIYPLDQVSSPLKHRISPGKERGFKIDAGSSDRILSDPVLNESVLKDPVLNDPVSKDPVSNDPVSKNPVLKDPVLNDPVLNDPVSRVLYSKVPHIGEKDVVDLDWKKPQKPNPIVSHAGTASQITSSPLKDPQSSKRSAAHRAKHYHDAAQKVFLDMPYDVWAPEDFEVVILLDNREIRSKSERDFFYNKISGRGVACDVRALSVGDVLWIARHKKTQQEVVLNYVCERKRIDDLAGSIKDGRFAEQKSRLKKSGIKNVHYLVEEGGLMDVQRVVDMKISLETSISMVITVSNFFMQRFKKTDDTIEWLVTMTKVLEDRYKGIRLLSLKPRQVKTQDDYLSMLEEFRRKFETRKTPYECVHRFSNFQDSLVKTNMLTVKEMFVKMLMSVRGISFEKAILIQKHFPTPRALIEFYIDKEALSEEQKGMLILEKFRDEIGPRKFNKPSSVAMYEAWGKAICSG